MASAKEMRMFSKNISAKGTYEGMKAQINFDNIPEVPSTKKGFDSKLIFAIGTPVLAASIAVGVFLGVNIANKQKGDGPLDIMRIVDHTLISDNHYELDVLGVDISPLKEEESSVLARRDIGRLINSSEEMNSFIGDYLIKDGSAFSEELKGFDDSYYDAKSLAVVAYYEEEGTEWKFEHLDQFVYGLTTDVKSKLSVSSSLHKTASAEAMIYTAVIEVAKSTIESFQYQLTSNDVLTSFWFIGK